MFKIESIIKSNACFYRLLLFYFLSVGIGAINEISNEYSSYGFIIFFGCFSKIISFSIILGSNYDFEIKIDFS